MRRHRWLGRIRNLENANAGQLRTSAPTGGHEGSAFVSALNTRMARRERAGVDSVGDVSSTHGGLPGRLSCR